MPYPNKNKSFQSSVDILSWNAHSLNSSSKKLFLLSRSSPICCVQETWGASIADLPLPFSPVNLSNWTTRSVSRGGGTLAVLHPQIIIHKEVGVNKDSKLLRLVIHGNKILWLCNCYLNKGKSNQIQKLFKVLRNEIPFEERNRLIIIGDLNVNLNNKKDERVKLLLTLSKELGLKVIEPKVNTFRNSKLDFAIVSKDLSASLQVSSHSLSDHLPIILKVDPKIMNPSREKVCIPNRKLAEYITISSLLKAKDALSWIKSHQEKFEKFKARVMKRIKKVDYNRKLFERLTERKNIAISETINKFWFDLIQENESLRFSKDMAEAFKQLSKIFKYKPPGKDGSIVNCVKVGEDIIYDQNVINKLLLDVLKKLQLDSTKPIPDPLPFPEFEDITPREAGLIFDRMASNKALSFDLFSDIIFSQEYKSKTCELIKSLWNSEVTNTLDASHFEARLVPLNKKHPEVPKPEEFRPIIVMSPLVKLLETKLLPRLQSYLIMCRAGATI